MQRNITPQARHRRIQDRLVPSRRVRSGRSGFTLVEMLIAVTLVTLMMTLFASLFGMAGSLMSKQKGIAENDQRARTLVTLLKTDLGNRTFKEVAPFAAGENTAAATANMSERQGYLCISENATGDDTDDVLQLTVQVKNSDDAFFGRARALADGGGATTSPNQPEYDDGHTEVNETGGSRFAEVSYFLRDAVLYRRVMLIRDQSDGTPRDASNALLVTTPYEAAGATRNIWSDFDYSISYDSVAGKPKFHGTGELDNSIGGVAPSNIPSLGIPNFRWGFNHASGLPREKINSGNTWIGRFLQQETSDAGFGYPGRVTAGNPNPMDDTATPTLTLNASGIVGTYANGSRVAEDMLLSNVHAFDIKVWDPAANNGPDGQPGKAGVDDDANATTDDASERGWPGSDDGAFVDVGHTGGTGFYNSGSNQNSTYGNTFDTWHPNVDVPTTGASQDPPPFRPTVITLSGGTTSRNPLRAIQIKIRFYDISSDSMREVTLVQSLLQR